MKKRWYVIDSHENLISWDDKAEKGESFSNRTDAINRASRLAKDEPHKAFVVCAATDVVVVETTPVKVSSI